MRPSGTQMNAICIYCGLVFIVIEFERLVLAVFVKSFFEGYYTWSIYHYRPIVQFVPYLYRFYCEVVVTLDCFPSFLVCYNL